MLKKKSIKTTTLSTLPALPVLFLLFLFSVPLYIIHSHSFIFFFSRFFSFLSFIQCFFLSKHSIKKKRYKFLGIYCCIYKLPAVFNLTYFFFLISFWFYLIYFFFLVSIITLTWQLYNNKKSYAKVTKKKKKENF